MPVVPVSFSSLSPGCLTSPLHQQSHPELNLSVPALRSAEVRGTTQPQLLSDTSTGSQPTEKPGHASWCFSITIISITQTFLLCCLWSMPQNRAILHRWLLSALHKNEWIQQQRLIPGASHWNNQQLWELVCLLRGGERSSILPYADVTLSPPSPAVPLPASSCLISLQFSWINCSHPRSTHQHLPSPTSAFN